MADDLIPQKRVMSDLGISRCGLWRAMRSGIDNFPAPTIVRTRLYWRESELPALRTALAQFRGRSVFEQGRRHAKAVAARAEAVGLGAKVIRAKAQLAQPDLFGEADMPAPQDADAVKRHG